MAADSQYNDSDRPDNGGNPYPDEWQSVGDLSRTLCSKISEEGEAFYEGQSAATEIRPSLLFALAKVSRDLSHYTQNLKLVRMAAWRPEMAEGFAGEIVDGYTIDESEKADIAYGIALLAAYHSQFGDDDYQNLRDMVLRISGAGVK